MIRSMLKFFLLSVLFVFVINVSTSSSLEAGGEIPWPLSNQRVITMNNSKGLWRLESSRETKLFNVEMIDNNTGSNWVRVSELDTKTFEVLSWGEGYFSNCYKNSNEPDCKNLKPESSFSNIPFPSDVEPEDRLGRYLDMFPNGDLNKGAYLLRLVEVKTSIGNVLGLSIINFEQKKYEHYLGTRLLAAPLTCNHFEEKDAERSGRLTCDFHENF